jgi:hypothetical protein
MINVDLFEDEERQYINKIAEGRDREKLSRQDILSAVAFAREVADDTDTNIISLIDGVYSKVNALSDGEWDRLKLQLPFTVLITAEDNVDEVPTDTEDLAI